MIRHNVPGNHFRIIPKKYTKTHPDICKAFIQKSIFSEKLTHIARKNLNEWPKCGTLLTYIEILLKVSVKYYKGGGKTRMSKLSKKFLSVLLSIVMILSAAIPGYAAPNDEKPEGTVLETETADPSKLNVPRIGKAEEAPEEELPPYGLNDLVRVSIVLEKPATIEQGYSTQSIAENPDAISYRNGLQAYQDQVAAEVSEKVLGGQKLDVVWNITLLGNIISANVPYGKLDAIRALDGVKAVEIENQYSPASVREGDQPTMVSARDMTETSAPAASEYTGAGQKLAVIDTGLDDEHQSFNAEAFMHAIEEDGAEDLLLTKEEVIAIWPQLNFAKRSQNAGFTGEQAYLNEKVPFHANYVDNNLTTNHLNDTQEEHGSHVAGITSANRYLLKDGEFVDAAEEVGVVGQAPDAQIFVMKVFGARGGAYDSDYMVAIEDAMMLGADSVNLSLGSSAPGVSVIATAAYKTIFNNLVGKDLVVSISAGNNTSWDSQKALYSDDVNFHTGGSPGSYANSFTVASIDDSGKYAPFLLFNDSLELRYMDGGSANQDPMTSIAGEYEFVYVDGPGVDDNNNVGRTGDAFLALGRDVVAGKIALCNRGTSSFFAKANAAVGQGAAGVIIVNNVAGTISMALTGYLYTNPVASIKQAEGVAIKEMSEKHEKDGITYYTGKIVVGGEDNKTEMAYYEMSSFSSWGIPGSLILKPEITAPGGSVYSLNGYHRPQSGSGYAGGHDQYELMSGTSMAAPQITGIAAVIGQYYREANIAQRTGLSRRTFVQSIMMSTAAPVMEEASKNYYSLMKQGAGLADTNAAVSSDSYILMGRTATESAADGKVKVELGQDQNRTGNYQYDFVIHNFGTEAHSYEFNTDMFTQAVVKNGNIYNLDHTTVSLDSTAEYQWELSVKGDVNKDGAIDEADVQAVLDIVVGNYEGEYDADEADVDSDGSITSLDAQIILDSIGVALSGSGNIETLPAGAEAHVIVAVTLEDSTKAELNREERAGGYVEGFTFVKESDTEVEHSIPILGYFGAWTDPSMYDRNNYTDKLYGSEKTSYWNGTSTNDIYLQYAGQNNAVAFAGNPYGVEEAFPADRIAVSSGTVISSARYTLIRRAGAVGFIVQDEDGSVVYNTSLSEAANAYYNTQASTPSWQSTGARTINVNQKISDLGFKDGDKVKAGVFALPEFYTDLMDGNAEYVELFYQVLAENGYADAGAFFGYTFNIDDTAPAFDETAPVVLNEDGSITVKVTENSNLAYIALLDVSGKKIFGEELAPANTPGEVFEYTFRIPEGTDLGKAVYAFAGDYAGNEAALIARIAEGEITVDKEYYVPAETLEDGKEYLIVNTNQPGDAAVLSHNGSTKAVVRVKIQAAEGEEPAKIEADGLENAVFTAAASGDGFTLANNGAYLAVGRSGWSTDIMFAANPAVFTYDAENSRLSTNYNNRAYYIRYANNAFSAASSAASVYLFERKTKTVPFDPDAVEKVVVEPESMTLYDGQEADFRATVLPKTLNDKSVTWSVSDPELAEIDPATGHVKALKAGTVEVIATANKDHETAGKAELVIPERTHIDATVNAQITDASGTNFVKINIDDLSTEVLGESAGKHFGGGRCGDVITGFMADGNIVLTEIYDDGYDSYILGSFGTTQYNSRDGANIPAMSAEADGEEIKEEYLSLFVAGSYLLIFTTGYSLTGWGLNNYSAIAYLGSDETGHYYYLMDGSGQLQFAKIMVDDEEPIVDGELNLSLLTGDAEAVSGLNFSAAAMSMTLVETDDIAGLLVANNSTRELYFIDLDVEEDAALEAVLVGGFPTATDLNTLYNDDYDAITANEISPAVMKAIERVKGSMVSNAPMKAEKLAQIEKAPVNAVTGGLNAVKAKVTSEPDADGIQSTGLDVNVGFSFAEDEDVKNGYVEITYEPEKVDLSNLETIGEFKSLKIDEEEGVVKFAYANREAIKAGTALAKFSVGGEFNGICDTTEVKIATIERNQEVGLEDVEIFKLGGAGHDWGEPEWAWSADYSSATATFICKNDESHVEVLEAEIESEEGEDGVLRHTATVELDGKTYTDTVEDDYKFRVKVSSENADKSSGKVVGTVYGDFTAEILIEGEKVTTSNAFVDVWARNIASLGIEGVRHYGRGFQFGGTPTEVNLSSVANLFKPLDKSVIIAKNGENEVTYTVSMEDKDGYKFIMTPDSEENASAVWNSIVNEDTIEAGKKDNDSYIIIANGASFQVGSSILQFEEGYDKDLKLDNFDDLDALNKAIREAIALVKAEEAVDGIIIKLPYGTELALGASYAKLKECVTIKITGEIDTDAIEEILEKLRDTQGGDPVDIMHELFDILGEVIDMVGGKTTNVEFIIGHEAAADPVWTWAEDYSSAKAAIDCVICGDKVEVDAEVTNETTPATCEEAGKIVYTATAEISGKTYTDTKEVALEAIGHKWGEPEWTWTEDFTAASAKFVCENDPEHVKTIAAVVTDEIKDGKKIYTAKVEFEGKEYTDTKEVPAGIELDKTEVVLKSDSEEKITAKYIGTEEEAKNVVWTSSDEAVVEVDETGKLTPKKAGYAVITATADGLEATCDVQVLFDDVQNEKKFYYEPVYWALKEGVTSGKSAFIFAPEEDCLRSYVVTFLWRMNGSPEGAPDAGFKDVPAGKWYSEAVNWAAQKGIVTGYKDSQGNLTGEFGLNDPCKREEVVTILWRAAGEPKAETDSGFKDVPKGKWYSEAINWAAENGITTGLKDADGNLTGEFGRGRTCTRGEIITFLYRYANLQ